MNRLGRLMSLLPPGRTPVLLSMFNNGEERLSLEMLAENLYDLDVEITCDERSLLDDLAENFGVGTKYLDLIERLRLFEP